MLYNENLRQVIMEIFVCIGSSCHLKGSYKIVELLKNRLEEFGLTDTTKLNGAFCFGKCSENGVTIKVDDELISGINADNFENFFDKYILKA